MTSAQGASASASSRKICQRSCIGLAAEVAAAITDAVARMSQSFALTLISAQLVSLALFSSKHSKDASASCAYAQVQYIKGWGKFKNDSEVEVDLSDGGTQTVTAKNYLIATGSEVTSLPNVNIDEDR